MAKVFKLLSGQFYSSLFIFDIHLNLRLPFNGCGWRYSMNLILDHRFVYILKWSISRMLYILYRHIILEYDSIIQHQIFLLQQKIIKDWLPKIWNCMLMVRNTTLNSTYQKHKIVQEKNTMQEKEEMVTITKKINKL